MALLTVFFKMFGFRWLFNRFRPLISWIVFRLFLTFVMGVAAFFVTLTMSKTQWFWSQHLLVAMFSIYSTLFFLGFLNIDKWLLKVYSLAIPLSIAFGFLIKNFYPHLKSGSSYSLGLAFCIAVPLFLILSIKNNIFPNIKKIFEPKIYIDKTLQEIDQMGNGDTYEKGRQFEEYVAALYNAFGYHAETTTTMREKGTLPGAIQSRGGSGEQGVDVVLYDPRNGETYIIQCKHYSNKVSNSAIQEIVTAKALYNATRAFVVTNQEFTKPAIELADVNGVELVDRNLLPTLICNAVDCVKSKKAA